MISRSVRLSCMSGRSSVYAAVLALSVAFAGFAVFSVWAPSGLPVGAVWEGGLIREVVFEGGDFEARDIVQARLVYRNPSTRPVSVNVTYPVRFARFVDGKLDGQSSYGSKGFWEVVTVPAGGEYSVCGAGFLPLVGGWWEVEWDGAVWGVWVAKSEVVTRIVTDAEVYKVGARGGTASFEYYNPTRHNVTFGVLNTYDFKAMNPDGSQAGGFGVSFFVVDWERTLSPGEAFRVYTFYFPTTMVGGMTLTINDLSKTVQVIPR